MQALNILKLQLKMKIEEKELNIEINNIIWY